ALWDGRVTLGGVDPPWESFFPIVDGRQLLGERVTLGRVRLAGRVLAVEVSAPGRPAGRTQLYLFRGPDGPLTGGDDRPSPGCLIRPSDDGELLAVWRNTDVEVFETNGVRLVAELPWAGTHGNLKLDSSGYFLSLTVGTFCHVFDLRPGTFRHELKPLATP